MGYFGENASKQPLARNPSIRYADDADNIRSHSELFFDLGEYINDSQWKFYEENGAIPDEETAEKVGEELLAACFGEAAKQYEPYHAVYHAKYEAWLVYGTLHIPRDTGGGSVLNIILQKKDGAVLAMWGS